MAGVMSKSSQNPWRTKAMTVPGTAALVVGVGLFTALMPASARALDEPPAVSRETVTTPETPPTAPVIEGAQAAPAAAAEAAQVPVGEASGGQSPMRAST